MKYFFGPKKLLSQIGLGKINPDPDLADFTLIGNNASWVLPQLMAFLGNKVPIRKGENDKYSFTATLNAIKQAVELESLAFEDGTPVSSAEMLGILSIMRAQPRGKILGVIKQSSPEGLRYNGGVPLFCSAFKEYRNVKYSDWNWDDSNAKYFLDNDMLEYSQYFNTDFSGEYPVETLLNYRECALHIKSGNKAGGMRIPENTAAVYGIDNEVFRKLPRLLKLSLLQLWVFSPLLYNKYTITNTVDLDSPPAALVNSNLYKELDNVKEHELKSSNVPW